PGDQGRAQQPLSPLPPSRRRPSGTAARRTSRRPARSGRRTPPDLSPTPTRPTPTPAGRRGAGPWRVGAAQVAQSAQVVQSPVLTGAVALRPSRAASRTASAVTA